MGTDSDLLNLSDSLDLVDGGGGRRAGASGAYSVISWVGSRYLGLDDLDEKNQRQYLARDWPHLV